MNNRLLTLLLSTAISSAAMAQQTINLSITNPSKTSRKDVPVVINISKYGDIQSAIVKIDGNEIPCQLDDLDQDGTNDELCFITNFGNKENKKAVVTLSETEKQNAYNPRVFAELVLRNPKSTDKFKNNYPISSVTALKDDTDWFHIAHHHGLALESELIAMRIYFDNRQTPDMYGKVKKQLELKDTQFYTSKKQKAEGYGEDVLWVGNTFGLGAMRGWDGKEQQLLDDVNYRTQRIISYGPLRTIVEMEDRGWKADANKPRITMKQRYTLYAGHRDMDVDVLFNKPVKDYLFSTGIINVKNSTEHSDKNGLRGCWGKDWPNGPKDTINRKIETVGLGICIPKKYIVKEEPANDNYGYVIKTPTDRLSYKIAFASDNESFGYHSAKEWYQYLDEWKKENELPLIIKIK